MKATIGTVVTAGTTRGGNGFSYFNGVKNLMIVGIVLLGLIACRKDKDKPGEETGDKELVVSFVSVHRSEPRRLGICNIEEGGLGAADL